MASKDVAASGRSDASPLVLVLYRPARRSQSNFNDFSGAGARRFAG